MRKFAKISILLLFLLLMQHVFANYNSSDFKEKFTKFLININQEYSLYVTLNDEKLEFLKDKNSYLKVAEYALVTRKHDRLCAEQIDIRQTEASGLKGVNAKFKECKEKFSNNKQTFNFTNSYGKYNSFTANQISSYNLHSYSNLPAFFAYTKELVIYKKFHTGCNFYDKNNVNNSDCVIVVDVNGFNPPNKLGVDRKTFAIVKLENGIIIKP